MIVSVVQVPKTYSLMMTQRKLTKSQIIEQIILKIKRFRIEMLKFVYAFAQKNWWRHEVTLKTSLETHSVTSSSVCGLRSSDMMGVLAQSYGKLYKRNRKHFKNCSNILGVSFLAHFGHTSEFAGTFVLFATWNFIEFLLLEL